MNGITFIGLEEDMLVFKSVLKDGCPTIPPEMFAMAEQMAELIGMELASDGDGGYEIGGDYDKVWFCFGSDFGSEEEFDAAWTKVEEYARRNGA